MSHFSRSGRAMAACFVAALTAFLLAGRTGATSIRLPLNELSARSSLVVAGRVERIESAWNADRQIDTTAYIRLSEASRGHLSAGALIPVRVHGGTVNGLTMVSSEEPTFEVGEDVFLFLAGLQGDAYRLAAGEQSKFKVVDDRAANRSWPRGLRIAELKAGVQQGRWPADPALSGGTPGPSGLPAAPPPTTFSTAAAAEPLAIAPDAYVYTGAKWFGPNPMEETFQINVNTNDAGTANGSVEEFRNAILAAAYTWNYAGAAFSFKYGGLTGATSWADDGSNVIYWQYMGNTPTLAEAQWWVTGSGQILDVDMRFNDYYAWDVTGSPSGSEPDLQSVATHELGHWLSLLHDSDPTCPNSAAVMCASYVFGRLKRSLGANDIAGIKAIYGEARPPATSTPTRTPTPTKTATPTPTRTPKPVPTLAPWLVKGRVYLPLIRR
jgi:hypothetical protein